MAHLKFQMGQLHKDWKAAKDEAPKLAKKLKDGNAELALKDLYKNKFKAGLGDKLDQMGKIAKTVTAAQTATLAKPNNVKLQEKWMAAAKELLEAIGAVLRVVTQYKNAVNAEKKELGGVYDFLKKKLEGLQSSAEELLGQGKEFEKDLDHAFQQANTFYRSIEVKVRASRSYSDAEWIEYLAKNVDPKMSASFPEADFDF